MIWPVAVCSRIYEHPCLSLATSSSSTRDLNPLFTRICVPLAFDIFSGNQNEQTTLKPMEKKIIKDFNCSEFIFCPDAGLGVPIPSV